jgi:CRP-like cAMP-binding protein
MTSEDSLFQRFGRDFPRGTVLFREGEPGTEMYVVQRGRVRISKRVGDVEKVLSTLGPGEFLGEMSILSGKPRSATATIAEDARLLVVDAKTFEAMLRANAEIAARMIRKLAERLQQADEQIENLLLPGVSMRLAHYLLRIAERSPGQPVRVPIDELPGRLGVLQAELDLLVTRLAHAKVVSVVDGVLEVPDAARLKQFLDFLHMKSQFGEQP